ncbi:MAG: T9SS type A sorting domain-containing protein [Sphingobacteriaceae bacterium]|nr:T9SS type A sorting domain-containing protein [Sphingobacteriaceae bacterium]
MRKIYKLALLFTIIFQYVVQAQTSYLKVPAIETTTTDTRAANGTTNHVTFRGVYIMRASELTTIGTNTAINALGFFLNFGLSPAVTGTMQIYLENTSDLTYQKGINFTTAIAPMTSVYNNTVTIPVGTTTLTIPFPADFNYTGGGLYVAMDWVTTGPFSNNSAKYRADNTLPIGGAAISTTAVPASNTLVQGNVRPVFRVGYVNTYTNEAQVYGIYGNGRQPLVNGSPYSFSVAVRNNAGVAMTNVVPTLSVTGPTSFVATATIANINPGALAVVAFPGFTPTAQGMHTVEVILPSDENNTNNNGSIQHSVTCNYLNAGPPVPLSGNFTQGVGFNTGSGLLLNRTTIPNTSSLTALRIGIGNTPQNAGNAVYGVLCSSGGVILATTNTIVLAPSMFGTYKQFDFATPPTLIANSFYYVGLAQPANTVSGYFPLATMPSATNNMPSNIYATSGINGGFIGTITPTLGWFAIESVYDNGISLTVTPQTSTICSGNTLAITASGANSYSWSNGANTAAISLTPAVYSAYTCTGSAVVGTVGACVVVKSAEVFVNLTPTISCPNGAICPVGGSFTLNPSGAATYTISGGSAVVSPTTTSMYTITGESGAGCPSANTVVTTVSVSNNPLVSINGPSLICIGGTPLLTASGALTYSWSTGSTFSAVIVNPTIATTYTLTGYYGTCTVSATKQVSVSPNPTLSAQSSHTLLCIGETATLSAFGAGTYTWSTGGNGLTETVSPTSETTYTLTGAINGICQQSVAITQSVISCIGIQENISSADQINFYPNPNNGELNISFNSLSPKMSVEVLSITGQILLEEHHLNMQTKLNLKHLAKGVYFIRIKENNAIIRTSKMAIE